VDFRPVLDRLAWADRHVAHLRDVATAFVDRPPFVVTRIPDPQSRRVIYRAEQTDYPPAEIALAMSDVLHQLRATLDNAVGVLRTGGPTDRSAFVITRDPAVFLQSSHDRLEGVPGWAMDQFRDVQPFPDNLLRWIGDELSMLHDLARRDRHRALVLQAALVETDYVEVQHPGTGGEAVFRQRGPSIAEAEYPVDAIVKPFFKATLVIAEPDVAADRDVIGTAEALAARVGWLVRTLAETARVSQSGS
jgi:hypothetical protein